MWSSTSLRADSTERRLPEFLLYPWYMSPWLCAWSLAKVRWHRCLWGGPSPLPVLGLEKALNLMGLGHAVLSDSSAG